MTPQRWRRVALSAGVCAAVVAADQATKSLAEARLTHPVHLVGPFGLALEFNSGSAFSLFSGHSWWILLVDVVLVVALMVAAWRAQRLVVSVALGLVLGGALGNITDRLVRSHHGDVTDFITLSHWPTFNVADACITVGIILVALSLLRRPAPPEDVAAAGETQ